MREKLTLHHLAKFLPYGLKIQRQTKYDSQVGTENESDIVEMTVDFISEVIENENPHWTAKPILRPLSDLTREIEHNGEKFMPMCILNGWVDNDTNRNRVEIPTYLESLPYADFKKLFEWHFDVDDLIKKGLAVDMNTTK